MTGLQPEAIHLLFPTSGSTPSEPHALNQWLTDAADRNLLLRIHLTRNELATEESAKFSLAASPTVDLVAQILGLAALELAAFQEHAQRMLDESAHGRDDLAPVII